MGPGRGRRIEEKDEYDKLAEYEKLPLLFDRMENEIDEAEEEEEEDEGDEEEE